MNKIILILTLFILLALPFLGQAQYSSGVYTGKLNPSGQVIWEKYAGTNGWGNCSILDNCSDAHGNVYIVGISVSVIWFEETSLGGNLFVAKYDSSGNFIWANYIVTTEVVGGIVADSEENCYVFGHHRQYTPITDTIDVKTVEHSDNLCIIKYNKDGDALWIKSIISRDYFLRPGGISIDENSNRLYVTAVEDKQFRTVFSDSARHILASYKLPDCTPIKEITVNNHYIFGYIYHLIYGAYGIATDRASIYISGMINNQNGNKILYITKLDTAFNRLWEWHSGEGSLYASDMVLDDEKNVYVTGQFEYSILFGDTTLTSKGSADIFIAKFNKNGENIWVKNIGAPDSIGKSVREFGYSIDFDHKNSIYVSGYAGKNAEFSPTFNTSNSGPFLAKLTKGGEYEYVKSFNNGWLNIQDERGSGFVSCDKNGNLFFSTSYLNSFTLGSQILKQGLNPLVNVYPNPCHGTLNTRYISGASGEIGLKIFNLSGQEVFAAEKNTVPGNNTYTLNLSSLKSGVYFLSISEGRKRVAINKFIIE